MGEPGRTELLEFSGPTCSPEALLQDESVLAKGKAETRKRSEEWAHLDSNQEPKDYESSALTD